LASCGFALKLALIRARAGKYRASTIRPYVSWLSKRGHAKCANAPALPSAGMRVRAHTHTIQLFILLCSRRRRGWFSWFPCSSTHAHTHTHAAAQAAAQASHLGMPNPCLAVRDTLHSFSSFSSFSSIPLCQTSARRAFSFIPSIGMKINLLSLSTRSLPGREGDLNKSISQ